MSRVLCLYCAVLCVVCCCCLALPCLACVPNGSAGASGRRKTAPVRLVSPTHRAQRSAKWNERRPEAVHARCVACAWRWWCALLRAPLALSAAVARAARSDFAADSTVMVDAIEKIGAALAPNMRSPYGRSCIVVAVCSRWCWLYAVRSRLTTARVLCHAAHVCELACCFAGLHLFARLSAIRSRCSCVGVFVVARLFLSPPRHHAG
jgi:hypothetical protein